MTEKPGKTDAEKEINFSALKKHDDGIQQIIDTASSVAHYKFNSLAVPPVWEKTDVEGSLFLYSRRTPPYIIIFIMNRLNQNNAKLTLTHEMEFKVQEPFLLCKATASDIIGIWFYEPDECRRFGAVLNRFRSLAHDERSLQISIMMEAQKQHEVKTTNFSSSSTPASEVTTGNPGILGMFTQAQDEYTKSRMKFAQEQSKTKPKANNQKQTKKDDGASANQRKVPFQRGVSEPSLKSSPNSKSTIEQIDVQSLRGHDEEQRKPPQTKSSQGKEDLLYNLLHGGNNKQQQQQQQQLHRSRTMSTELEMQHHNNSLVGNDLISTSSAGDLAALHRFPDQNFMANKVIDCAELESQLCKQRRSLSTIEAMQVGDNFRSLNGHSEGHHRTSVDDIVDLKSSDDGSMDRRNSSNLLPLSSSSSSCSSPLSSDAVTAKNSTSLTNHLLSPHVMLSGKGKGTNLSPASNASTPQNFSLAANFNKQTNKIGTKLPDSKNNSKSFPESGLKSLMSPAAFKASQVTKQDSETSTVPKDRISREEFQKILIDMIKTDETFVENLHNAFLERLGGSQ